MAVLENLTLCEECSHNKVCSFKAEQREFFSEITDKIDNSHCPEIFKFTFLCKEFQRKNVAKPF